MKRVLITGARSYVGTHVMKRLQKEPKNYIVQELDVKGDAWKSFDFSEVDTVFHVAGIAHVSTDPSMEPLYMQVNRDLTIEVAEQAKNAGVRQFIFMSSAIVYGDSAPAGTGLAIDYSTESNPSNFYGRSKLEAEEGLRKLESGTFKVAIIRAPMIFGAHAKGNFPKLVSIARKFPVFPNVNNKRSMIYIENLAEFVFCLISRNKHGLFFPQQEKQICTSELVSLIAKISGNQMHMIQIFNPLIKGPLKHNSYAIKAFGDLYYNLEISSYDFDYIRFSTSEAMKQIAQIESWAK